MTRPLVLLVSLKNPSPDSSARNWRFVLSSGVQIFRLLPGATAPPPSTARPLVTLTIRNHLAGSNRTRTETILLSNLLVRRSELGVVNRAGVPVKPSSG